MRRWFLGLVLVTCAATLTMAERGHGGVRLREEGFVRAGPRVTGEQRLKQLDEKLGLDEAQKQQISQIMEEMFEQRQAAKGNRQLMKKTREEMRAKINEVLTPEQRDKLSSIRKEMKNERGTRGNRGIRRGRSR